MKITKLVKIGNISLIGVMFFTFKIYLEIIQLNNAIRKNDIMVVYAPAL